jgi:ribosomal protein S18 acetylase RimI-like enzyme
METGRPVPRIDGLSCRTATKADVAGVLALWRRAETARSTADDPAGVGLLVRTNPEALILAVDGDRIVGTLTAVFDGWRGNMYRLAVHTDYRRRGIGLALVEEGEKRLRQRGVRRVTALVAHEQRGATELWVASGYGADPYTSRYVKTL